MIMKTELFSIRKSLVDADDEIKLAFNKIIKHFSNSSILKELNITDYAKENLNSSEIDKLVNILSDLKLEGLRIDISSVRISLDPESKNIVIQILKDSGHDVAKYIAEKLNKNLIKSSSKDLDYYIIENTKSL